MLKEYDRNKASELVITVKKIKEEADDFEKKWMANGLPIYDKSGNLIVENNDDKKAPKKKN